MAQDLGIKRCWFHKTHYDIPKKRLDEIKNKCNFVTSRQIVMIIKNCDANEGHLRNQENELNGLGTDRHEP